MKLHDRSLMSPAGPGSVWSESETALPGKHPNHLSWFLSILRSSGSTPRFSKQSWGGTSFPPPVLLTSVFRSLHRAEQQRLFENLRMLPHAPGVQMQPIPEDSVPDDTADEDTEDPDKRMSIRASDKRIACDEEFSDSEDEGEGGRRNVANHKKGVKRARVEDDRKEGEEKKGEVKEEEKPKEINSDKHDSKSVKTEQTSST
ncbi:hypothetical protein PGIGA_G00194140 [Pangasianodon gigas]|uniref:Uncharacterized protein n=1 Tax=Pangasianodon gigas TaxID=30993 RepID=A0ACC5XWP9_PANGG|nr:hypothetical protein [Pangasianodon gigas]